MTQECARCADPYALLSGKCPDPDCPLWLKAKALADDTPTAKITRLRRLLARGLAYGDGTPTWNAWKVDVLRELNS